MSYRDGEAVVREMLAGKRADALSRARSFGYAQRCVIDEESIAHVEALHDRAMPSLFDDVCGVEETKTAIAKVEELIAGYDALLSRSAAARISSVIDVEAAFAKPEDWRGTRTGAERLAGEIEARISREAVETFEVRPHGVAIANGPWALLVGLDETGSETHVQGRITLAIPAAVPPVSMHLERGTQSMMEDLGLVREVETGDYDFDVRYWIRGREDAALAAATPLLRRVLIDLAEHDGAFVLEAGIARVSWSGPWQTLGASGVPKNLVPAILELRTAFCE